MLESASKENKNQRIISGAGESVQIAHEMAASDTLRRLFGTAEHQFCFPFKLVVDPLETSVPNVSVGEWCDAKVEQLSKQVSRAVQ